MVSRPVRAHRLIGALLLAALALAPPALAQKPAPASPLELGADPVAPLAADGLTFLGSSRPAILSSINAPVPPGSPEAQARAYLAGHRGVVGLRTADASDLALVRVREGRAGTVVRFRQTVGGVPVWGDETVVTIDRRDRVQFLANGYRDDLSAVDLRPAVSEGAARAAVFAHLGLRGAPRVERTELVVWPSAPARLAWSVRAESASPRGDWEGVVDAHTGELLRVADRMVYERLGADDPTPAPMVPLARTPALFRVDGTAMIFNPDPLTRAGATYGGQYVDGGDADTAALTAARSAVTLRDLTFDGVNYNLVGPWAEIRELEAPAKGLFAQPSPDYDYTRNADAFEAANVYWHIDNYMRYVNVTLGVDATPQAYTTGVRYDPHGVNGDDNSYFSSGSDILVFGEGCVDDAEDADVVIHELGHGLHDWLSAISNGDGLSEGFGDYVASSYTRSLGLLAPTDPEYHWVFKWDGHNECWGGRATNIATDYPTGSAPHARGQHWSTSNMRVWDVLGREATDVAVFEGLAMTNGSTTQPQAAQAVIQAAANMGYSAADLQTFYDSYTEQGYSVTLPLPPPTASVSPSSLSETLPPAGTSQQTVTISNTAPSGSASLEWSLAIVRDDALRGPQAPARALPKGSAEADGTGSRALAAGGPDAYGYIFADSDEPGGPAVAFQDISGTGTPLAFSSADDGSATATLPFAFPFYGASYTSLGVSTNGLITLGGTSTAYDNAAIPTAAAPNAFIAPYWDDLHQRSGTAYTGTLGDGRFVVQWTNWGRYSPSSGESLTFQVILSPGGEIEIQYGTVTTTVGNSATVGIENADGTDGLPVAVNAAYIASDKAVRFTPPTLWITASPSSGSVAPGASGTFDVTFDATELAEGTYTADLVLSTNDPDHATITIPVTLTVGEDDGSISIVVDGARGMRYLGAPADGVTVDDLADQNLVRGVPGYYPAAIPPNLWTSYDAVAAEWVVSDGTGEVLEPGQAFRWFMYDRNVGNPDISRSVTLPFTLSTDLPANTADVTVTLQTGGSRFNYLANPFGVALDVTQIFSWPGGDNVAPIFGVEVFDEIAKSWVAASGPIGPWRAFRIRAKGGTATRTLTIPYPAAPPVASAREAAEALAEADRAHGIARLPFALSGRTADGDPLAAAFAVAFTDDARAAIDEADGKRGAAAEAKGPPGVSITSTSTSAYISTFNSTFICNLSNYWNIQ